jgi:hypothetical protein
MTEPERAKSVRLVRAAGDTVVETDAVVERPGETPWSVVPLEPANSEPVGWQVVIYMTSDSNGETEPMPFVFESHDVAKAWVEKHGLADQFTWEGPSGEEIDSASNDVPEGFGEEFLRIAEDNDVTEVSREAFDLAREHADFGKQFRSLMFFPVRALGRTEAKPPYPIPSGGEIYKLPWTPASCRHTGSSKMWDATGLLYLPLTIPYLELSPLPLPVAYASTV